MRHSNGQIIAYAALRRFALGWFMGPIVSSNSEDLPKLIYNCAAPSAGQLMRIDVASALVLSHYPAEIVLQRTDCGTNMLKN